VTNLLRELMQERDYLLADGAMGTSLMALGLGRGELSEQWNVAHPERVRQVHQGFIDAGADLLLTNTFGANRLALGKAGLAGHVAEYNRAAVEQARAVADTAGRPVLVCGSLGPTGQLLKPLGKLTREEAEAAFAEQAQVLAESGVDLLWLETHSALEELHAALAAALATGLPYAVTLSFDTRGRTMMGTRPAAAWQETQQAAVPPIAFGANCGSGPAQLVETVLAIVAATGADATVIAKGNCGKPRLGGGYDGTPELMAVYARLARDAGATIIGGCCGTTAEHLAAMAAALAETPRGTPPSAERVAELLAT
jgi:5-methyltetrahydrofolate--homocysteine methyltransferase